MSGRNLHSMVVAALAVTCIGTSHAESGKDKDLTEAGDLVQILLPLGGYVGAWMQGDKEGAYQLTKALGAAGLSAHVFKQLAERGRPDASDSRSFPSGHTTAAFAGSEFIRVRYGNAWGIPATVAAAFVGYTRIRANKHFRDDVLAGASNGLMWNWYFTSPYADSMAIRPTAFDDGYGFDIYYEFDGERLPHPDDGRNARFRYTLEWGPVSQDTNLFRSPLNGGFPIDLATAETEFDFTSRVSFDYFADRHEWSAYLAPMELIEFDTAAVLTEPALFAGTVFEPNPGSDFEARYNFIEARAVYRYRLTDSARSIVRIGAGVSYQQSLLEITQFLGSPRDKVVIDSATADIKKLKGIASLRIQHRFTPRIEVELQADGFPGSDHYLNAALLLNWRAAPGWSMGIGARYIDREVSSDDVYNKLQVGDLVLTVSHDFFDGYAGSIVGLAGLCPSRNEDGRWNMKKMLFLLILLPGLALGQASTIVSDREPIVVYDESELNPIAPRYEWTGDTLLQDIRVIDGTGSRSQRGQDVLISAGIISAIGKTGTLDVPEGARVISGEGLTVMPGLIDAHMHMQGGWRGGNDNGPRPMTVKWDLLAFLYSGVTHIYDIGNIPELAADARDIVDAGGWLGPDITIAGTYFETAPVGAVGQNTLLMSPDSSVIGAQLDTMKNIYGVEMVKCHSGTNSQILRVLVAEAEQRDMRVVCDLWHNNMSPWIARQTHLHGYAHNTFNAVPLTAEDAQILAEEGTFVVTTNVVMDAFSGARYKAEGLDYIKDNALVLDVQPPHYIEAHNSGALEETLARYTGVGEAVFFDVVSADEIRDNGIAATKLLIENGVLTGMGTDAAYPTVWFGESLHREMEIWVNEAGISPLRTIQAATHDNARILKIDERTGSVAVGLEADLLVVEGNPEENISDTRNIRYVFSNGKLVDRVSLTRQWRF